MSIKICASSSKYFTKIEEILSIIDKDFYTSFHVAELAIEGFNNDIKVTADYFFGNKIKLPKNFLIEMITVKPMSTYEKNSNNDIEEKESHIVEIRGSIDSQIFIFVYNKFEHTNYEIEVSG